MEPNSFLRNGVLVQAIHWSNFIDRWVSYLKWPAAFAAALSTPLLLWSALQLVVRVAGSPWNLFPFVLGAIAFFLVWRRWIGNNRLGQLLITLEHEATHALFALLTLHRIVAFRASLGRGGQVKFLGKGNWLITVAPYFFPTAALLLFLVAFLLPFPGLPWRGFLLGISLAYHIVSTIRETHRDQTDIQVLGATFCWLFLPAANLLVVGFLVSYAHGGTDGLALWFQQTIGPFSTLWQALEQLLQSVRSPAIEAI